MGLDMYLHAKQFFADADFLGEKRSSAYKQILEAVNGKPMLDEDTFQYAEVSLKVAQWRKANQIHKWFVDNCGEGEDNCRPYHVSREQIQELLELCSMVKKGGKALAEEHLPPESGFFFGSTDYDEWYWEQIDETIKDLTRVLERVPEDWEFEYQASW